MLARSNPMYITREAHQNNFIFEIKKCRLPSVSSPLLCPPSLHHVFLCPVLTQYLLNAGLEFPQFFSCCYRHVIILASHVKFFMSQEQIHNTEVTKEQILSPTTMIYCFKIMGHLSHIHVIFCSVKSSVFHCISMTSSTEWPIERLCEQRFTSSCSVHTFSVKNDL